jgi:hypothetical protein
MQTQNQHLRPTRGTNHLRHNIQTTVQVRAQVKTRPTQATTTTQITNIINIKQTSVSTFVLPTKTQYTTAPFHHV